MKVIFQSMIQVLLASVFALGASIASAKAQEQVPTAQAEEKTPASPTGVYVDDSFEAEELIRVIQDRVAQGDWATALNRLEQVLNQYDHHVIRNSDGVYINIRDFLNHQIATWPQEGLQAYIQRYEPIARQMLTSVQQDLYFGHLSQIADRYFCTPSGFEAAGILAQMDIESGQFESAYALYRRLLSEHPLGSSHANELGGQMILCLTMMGHKEEAEAMWNEKPKDFESLSLNWKGQSQPLQTIWTEIRSASWSKQAQSETESVEDWPMMGGGPDRGVIPTVSELPTAPLWTYKDFAPSTLSRSDGYFQSSSFRTAYSSGKFLSFLPAVWKQQIFFNDDMKVWALDRETGAVLWTHDILESSGADFGWVDRSVPLLHSVSVEAGRVYAVLGYQATSYYGYQPGRSQSVLICLDATDGHPIWRVSPADFDEDPREVLFEGPAVVQGGNVYVSVRRRKPFGFEDCYLWKFDRSGALQWKTHLASASVGGFGYRRPTLSIPILIDRTVYVQTNLGAIAAVDAESGLIDWLAVYEMTFDSQKPTWVSNPTSQALPWDYNPMLRFEGVVDHHREDWLVALPMDTSRLFLIERRTGQIKAAVPITETLEPQTLVGVSDGKLYGVGRDVFCFDLRQRSVVWSQPLPSDASLYGRATMSRSHLFIPFKAELRVYPLEGGEPRVWPLDPAMGGGNLVLTPEQVLVAGNDRITAYGVREKVFSRLEAQMKDHATDIEPALRLAEVSFHTAASQSAGEQKAADYRRGRESLDEAVRRAGGFAGMLDSEIKHKVFDRCMDCGELLLREQPPAVDEAIELYQMAGRCPPDLDQLLLQKVQLAAAYHLKQDWAGVVRIYQQILGDRSLRDQPWPESSERKKSAHEICTRRIGNLIVEHGREIYRSFDDQAGSMLGVATTTRDVNLLDQIIDGLPNSLSAPKALMVKGQLLRQNGSPVPAARIFYAALVRYPEQIDAADAIRQIADSYSQAGRPELAWLWLTKGAREYPSGRIAYEGKTITWSEYRARLGDLTSVLRCPRPQIVPPLEPGPQRTLNESDRVLTPEYEEHRRADWSYMVMYSSGSILAHDPVTGQSRWTKPVPVHDEPRLLAQLKNVVVVSTRHEIIGIAPGDGHILWQVGQRPAQIDDPLADHENFPTWQSLDLYESTLAAIRSDGELVCLDVDSGQIRWKQHPEPKPTNGPVGLSDSCVFYPTVTDRSAQVIVLSAQTGERQQVVELPEPRSVLRIRPTWAGNVLLVTSQSIGAINPLTGKIEWYDTFNPTLMADTVHVALDGVVLSPDGLHLVQLNLDDGREMWRSDVLARKEGEIFVWYADDEIYVLNENRIFSIDSGSGRTLGIINPQDSAYLQPIGMTPDRLLLIGQSFSEDPPQTRNWFWALNRPILADQTLAFDRAQLLGPCSGAIEFYGYDSAIMERSENTLRTWIGVKVPK